jgi:cytochrome c peroxidase
MRNKIIFTLALVTSAVLLVVVAAASAQGTTTTLATLTDQEQLGKDLFIDINLSDPAGEACAACHGPSVGYTGPDQAINAAGAVYEGAVAGRFGNRKPPAAAYAGDSPILYFDGEIWIGGMFWDGRATG